ncbi:hypothetical protein Tco_1349710 [Tanacetum coccineum]
METIHVTFDELIAMASEQLCSGPGLQFMTPGTSRSGLVPNPVLQQPFNPPTRNDWEPDTPRAIDLADSLVSTSVDQDAPSTSIPSTQEQEESPIISQGVEESPKNHTFMMIYFMKLFMKTQLLKDRHLMCGHPTLHLNFLVNGLRIIQ